MAIFRVMYPILLMVLVVLVAGCTLPQGTVNRTSITTMDATTPIIEPVTTVYTIQTQCPVGKNATPYININPVGDHSLGDVIEINGTTNCEEGEVLIWIRDTIFIPCPRQLGGSDSPCPCCDGVYITAPIIPGICGNNTWSFELNTSQHHFYAGKFFLDANVRRCGDDGPYIEYFNITSVPPSARTSIG